MKPSSESQSTDPNRLASALGDEVAPSPSRRRFAPAGLRVLSDERLARAASEGDRAAFAAVFDRFRDELYRYCLSLLRDREDAADALQSTMVRALRALDGDDREIALRPWLYRIAHNESMTMLRRPRAEAAAESTTAGGYDVEASAAVRAELESLLADIRELPERQRGALVMRELAGLDYKEIAAALDSSPAGAKQAVYEARRSLYSMAQARDADCQTIQKVLSDGDRRALRGRTVRAHLRTCEDCRAFRAQIDARESGLAALAPTMPLAAAAHVLQGALAGAGAGMGGTVGAGFVAALATTVAVAPVAAIAVALALGAGALVATELEGAAGPLARGAVDLPAPAPFSAAAKWGSNKGADLIRAAAGRRLARDRRASGSGAAAVRPPRTRRRGPRTAADQGPSQYGQLSGGRQTSAVAGSSTSAAPAGGPCRPVDRLRYGSPENRDGPVRSTQRQITNTVGGAVDEVRTSTLPVEAPTLLPRGPRLQS